MKAQSPNGDIIDCVRISDQPAFDHTVQNLQMRPSIRPSGQYDENEVASKMETPSIRQVWHQNGRCAEGTISIKRTKKEDVLRASSGIKMGGAPRAPSLLRGPRKKMC
ncbi:hypothetical protein COCNU_14G012450 [Cocos nucifera]|uniref:Neprosin activation peptide domain-containing protein n=1 Tax=Cocos nucifera TaxID=13894 RepID=A0A8K0IW43_COCNU|nr:hypothetical protein COCNU_14G012450 [Cocos nucifera]